MKKEKEVKKGKALFIHGLASGAHSQSGQHVINVLGELGVECFSDSFDVLNPVRAINRIKRHIDDVDFIVGHSLGAFYLLGGAFPEVGKKCVLINPCVLPIEKIPALQRVSELDMKKYYTHVNEIFELQTKNEMAGESEENRKNIFAIFAENDDVLNFRNYFEEHFAFKGEDGSALNVATMPGGHRILDDESIRGAMVKALEFFGGEF